MIKKSGRNKKQTKRFMSLQMKASLFMFGVSFFVVVSLLSFFFLDAVTSDLEATSLAVIVRQGSYAIAVACIVLLVATTAAVLVVRRMIVPLVKLRDMTEAVAKGDFTQMAEEHSQDEIGDLAVSFNEMIRKLRTTTVSLDEMSALIDEKEEAEHLFRESESRFKQIADNAREWVWEVDADGLYIYSNNMVKEILGYDPDEIVAKKHVYDLFHPDDREALKSNMEKTFSNKDSFLEFRNKNVHKDGRAVWLMSSGSPILDVYGSLLGYRGADTDISERIKYEHDIQSAQDELEQKVDERTKELNERASEAEKLNTALMNLMEDAAHANKDLQKAYTEIQEVNEQLSSFSHIVSHDLRAPLRHMIGFVNLLRETLSGKLNSKSERYLTIICQAAERMQKLIDDILAFSRTGRQELKNDVVNLAQIIEEARTVSMADVEERNIDWKIDKLPSVIGDRAMLKLAFRNLLMNSVKYTSKEPHACINIELLKSENNEVIVVVRDNGAGFDMKYADRLFGMFQRLHTEAEFKGTGIGLANVKRIITRHGGRVWAKSKIASGAAFFVALPEKRDI